MTDYALRLANGQDTAARVRAGDALSLHPSATLSTVRARGGILPGKGYAVVSVVLGQMQVQVTPFTCWVDASPAGQVGYPFVNDATKTLTIDPGDATQVRVDTVAVVVKENAFDGSGATSAVLTVVKGTPGAGAPAMPTSACIPLRDINVPAGASTGTGGLSSGDLSTDRRVWTTSAGGMLLVTSTTRPANPQTSAQIYEADTLRSYEYAGSAWRPANPAAMPYFKGTINAATALATGANIAFTADEDTHGGWSANEYTTPEPGVYRLRVRLKWNGTQPAVPPVIKFLGDGAVAFTSGQLSQALQYGSCGETADIRFAAGVRVSVQLTQGGFTTQVDPGSENNYFVVEYLRP